MNAVDFSSFLPLVLVFGAMYFFVIRPQSKKAKEHKDMLNALQSGDSVVTSGGLIGAVVSISDREVQVELAKGVVVTVLRAMIAEKIVRTKTPKLAEQKASPAVQAKAPKPAAKKAAPKPASKGKSSSSKTAVRKKN